MDFHCEWEDPPAEGEDPWVVCLELWVLVLNTTGASRCSLGHLTFALTACQGRLPIPCTSIEIGHPR